MLIFKNFVTKGEYCSIVTQYKITSQAIVIYSVYTDLKKGIPDLNAFFCYNFSESRHCLLYQCIARNFL
jgi:hypothetical protein